jgi:hypothetical protein
MEKKNYPVAIAMLICVAAQIPGEEVTINVTEPGLYESVKAEMPILMGSYSMRPVLRVEICEESDEDEVLRDKPFKLSLMFLDGVLEVLYKVIEE